MKRAFINFSIYVLLVFVSQTVLAKEAMRVVSVGGGITEIIYALGAGDALVGVDTTSVYPAAALKLPKVGYMRALSVEGLASLQPDYVLLTDDAGPPHSIEKLKTLGVEVITLNKDASLEALFSRIDTLAELFNKQKQAGKLKQIISEQQGLLENLLASQAEKQSALFILSHGGHALSIAGEGTSADSLLKLAGLKNVAHSFEGYRILGQEGVLDLNPDIIITTDQGVEAWGSKDKILSQEGIQFTNAAKQGKLISMDAMYLLSFGPRVVEAARDLNKHIYQ